MAGTRHSADGGDGTRAGDRRRWGPFSGAQLTIIVVAIAAVLVPTAASAAGVTFFSTTSYPAVQATNSSSADLATGVVGKQTGTAICDPQHCYTRFGVTGTVTGTGGVGVEGTGLKNGVVSNGPFLSNGNATIAPGSTLTCGACVGSADLAANSVNASKLATGSVSAGKLGPASVGAVNLAAGSVTSTKLAAGSVTPAALSAAAKAVQSLGSGQSESGAFGTADSYPSTQPGSLYLGLTFVRPVSGAITFEEGPTETADCPAPGQAAPGFLCLYYDTESDSTLSFAVVSFPSSPATGAEIGWTENGAGQAAVLGSYTVTAP